MIPNIEIERFIYFQRHTEEGRFYNSLFWLLQVLTFKEVSLMQIGVLHAYWVPPWIPVGNGPLGLLLAWSVPGNLTKAGCFVSLAKLQFLIMMLLCSIMVRGSQMLLGLKTTSSDRTSVKIVLYFPLLRQTSLQHAQTSPNTSLRFLHLQYLHPHPSLLKSYVKYFKF